MPVYHGAPDNRVADRSDNEIWLSGNALRRLLGSLALAGLYLVPVVSMALFWQMKMPP